MDITRRHGRDVDLRPTMDKIRSCVEEVVRPLAECPPHHTYVYNAICPILRELPEYKLLQGEVRRLAAQLEVQNAELERMKHDLNELSSGGEEMVLEVRDRQGQTAGDDERESTHAWERDGASQCSSSDGDSAPTFPPSTIKRIMFGLQAETEVTEDGGRGEAERGESEAETEVTEDALRGEAERVEEEEEEEEPMSEEEEEEPMSEEEEVVSKEEEVVSKEEEPMSEEEEVASGDDEDDEDDEEEEVEEMIIQGTSYYCSATTIYECAPNGDVGEEVGVFRNKLPIFHMDDRSDPDADFI